MRLNVKDNNNALHHSPVKMLVHKRIVLYWKSCKTNYHSRVPINSTHMGYPK